LKQLKQLQSQSENTVWPDGTFHGCIKKLEEEFSELMEQFTSQQVTKEISNKREVIVRNGGEPLSPCEVDRNKAKDEMGDLLFVMANTANQLGFTLKDALHAASVKVLQRVNDQSYNKD